MQHSLSLIHDHFKWFVASSTRKQCYVWVIELFWMPSRPLCDLLGAQEIRVLNTSMICLRACCLSNHTDEDILWSQSLILKRFDNKSSKAYADRKSCIMSIITAPITKCITYIISNIPTHSPSFVLKRVLKLLLAIAWFRF